MFDAPQLPHDDHAETQLVSLVATYPEFWAEARHIRPDQFRLVEARAAWQALTDALNAGSEPDPTRYL